MLLNPRDFWNLKLLLFSIWLTKLQELYFMFLLYMWRQSHSTTFQLIMVLALGKAKMWRIHKDIGTVEHILMGILSIWYLCLVDLSRGLRKFNHTWRSDIYYQLLIFPNTKSVSYYPVTYFQGLITVCRETKRFNWVMLH